MSERRKHLEFLRKTARDAAWAGDYERALLLFEDGLGLARSWKDRELEDLFTCNRTMALIEMDREDFDLSRLKEIILRNPSGYNAVLASYVSATAHETRGEYSRARFYAQSALTKGRELGLEELSGTSLNLLANLNRHEMAHSAIDADLNARIESFELAYRMQTAAPDAFDIEHEPDHIKSLSWGASQRAVGWPRLPPQVRRPG